MEGIDAGSGRGGPLPLRGDLAVCWIGLPLPAILDPCDREPLRTGWIADLMMRIFVTLGRDVLSGDARSISVGGETHTLPAQ